MCRLAGRSRRSQDPWPTRTNPATIRSPARRVYPVVPRLSFASMPKRFAAPPLRAWLAVVLATAGCDSESASTSAVTDGQTVLTTYAPDASNEAGPANEGGDLGSPSVLGPELVQGSPLCNRTLIGYSSCDPDDADSGVCADDTDAGSGDTEPADSSTQACRVPIGGDGGPTCTPAGSAAAGSPCTTSADCAAPTECVVTSPGAFTCQTYCCAGDTACQPDEYCNIQRLAQDPSTRVPVCVPIEPCQLFDSTSCSSSETCAVVREGAGTIGCVPVGAAQAGDDCERDTCGSGLVCLGTWGARHCYKLCHTATSVECSVGQGCMTGLPMFPDPAFGVCE